MWQRWFAVGLVLTFIACGGESEGPSRNDGAPPGADGSTQQELPDSTVFLTRGDDGVLGGMGVASEGVVHFYAEELEAYWSVTLSAEEEEAATDVPLEVRVTVSDDREVSYSAIDPTGRFAPVFFGSALPDSGMHDLEVDSRALLEMDEPFFTTDLMGPNPFDELFLVPVAVGTFVRGTLIAIGTAAALSVIKSFIVGVCEAILPLHRDTCGWVGFAVEVASLAVAPGFGLKFATWAGAGGARMLGIDIAEFVAGKICDRVGSALESAVNREDASTAAMRNQFRTALTYYNYLLWRLGESPPEDEAKRMQLRETLEEMLGLLLIVGPAYREGYVYAHHPDLLPSYNALAAGSLTTAMGNYLKESSGLPVGANLTVLARNLDVVGSEVAQSTIRFADSDIGRSGIASFVGCTISVVNKVFFEDPAPGPGAPSMLEVDPTEALDELATFLTSELTDLHMEVFGEAAPTVTCLADLFEPNGGWESAHARPLPGVELGLGEAVTVDSLTLCGIGGMPVDEDWYAFPVAPINWRAEARIFNPGAADPDCATCTYDPSQRVCMDMYWYAQTNELAGIPPTRLRGQCGTVASEFSIGPVGVAGTAGETFRQILLHVYPEDRTSTVPVRYNLGFTR